MCVCVWEGEGRLKDTGLATFMFVLRACVCVGDAKNICILSILVADGVGNSVQRKHSIRKKGRNILKAHQTGSSYIYRNLRTFK